MKKMINKVSKNLSEKGLTLIEILASIILVTIILSAFFSFFIQSAKTGKTSEEVVDATYLAQVEMEKIYAQIKMEKIYELSRNGDVKDVINELVKEYVQDDPNKYIFTKKIDGSYVKLHFKLYSEPEMSGLVKLVIEVFEQDFELEKETRPRAKMETILEWRS
ncbi:hypothetical protein SAMN05421670_2264 [Psychrobacillus psychrotolerans]|uniref:Prepilin-type N-terminal cleavage/methylation domain-containing protein n=1 Tax=Psychrobacillus psychrotolerans TaxID=126156 RepID=A0A1I5YUM3_9BACI|nr:type II secretion system protein [Psychrobacillus psychrotolerans]SFQ47916.1 hypothetical protein SAMN05421670_2264 [Psychrobacillus psychrotolerans]